MKRIGALCLGFLFSLNVLSSQDFVIADFSEIKIYSSHNDPDIVSFLNGPRKYNTTTVEDFTSYLELFKSKRSTNTTSVEINGVRRYYWIQDIDYDSNSAEIDEAILIEAVFLQSKEFSLPNVIWQKITLMPTAFRLFQTYGGVILKLDLSGKSVALSKILYN